jgi:hypothetical protein
LKEGFKMKNDDMELVRGSGNEQQFLASVEEGKQALRDGKTLDHKMVVAALERIVSTAGREPGAAVFLALG